MSHIICINCNETGHMFKQCQQPITSYGVLGYRRNKRTKELEFLLVQRKDTIGYVDFLRGKFDESTLKILFEEMTPREHNKLLTTPFNMLWDNLWMHHRSKLYTNEYNYAKQKFYSVDIANIINNSNPKWEIQEFCIPKGRKNNKESTNDCAIREFTEETGYSKENIINFYKDSYLQEQFLGSNGVMYRHIYILALIDDMYVPRINKKNISQAGEIRAIKWFKFRECLNVFREYSHTKRNLIYSARNIIKNNPNFKEFN